MNTSLADINLNHLSRPQSIDNADYNDGFDLNLETDTIETLLNINNGDDIQALAEAIIEDADLPPEMLEELAEFIKIKAQNAPKEVTIQALMTSVIIDLKELAKEDNSLNIDELKTGITAEQKQVNPTELKEFLSEVLTSIASDGKTLTPNDAPLLAALLGIDDEDAQYLITETQGDVDTILDVFAGASTEGDTTKIEYSDLQAIGTATGISGTGTDVKFI